MKQEKVTIIIEKGEVQEVYSDIENLLVRVIYLDHDQCDVEFSHDVDESNNKQIN